MPSDFSLTTVCGKGYDTEDFVGETLWKDVVDRIAQCSVFATMSPPKQRPLLRPQDLEIPLRFFHDLGRAPIGSFNSQVPTLCRSRPGNRHAPIALSPTERVLQVSGNVSA
jgi:hypothetical protein